MLLEKNERFIKEVKNFSERIDRLSNEKSKEELKNLLKKLVNEVRNIDREHQEILMGNRLGLAAISDRRTVLKDIRKQLINRLISSEKTQ
jgi:predicted nuclease with TOPRIM domain